MAGWVGLNIKKYTWVKATVCNITLVCMYVRVHQLPQCYPNMLNLFLCRRLGELGIVPKFRANSLRFTLSTMVKCPMTFSPIFARFRAFSRIFVRSSIICCYFNFAQIYSCCISFCIVGTPPPEVRGGSDFFSPGGGGHWRGKNSSREAKRAGPKGSKIRKFTISTIMTLLCKA